MNLIGLELNSTRARALSGPAGIRPHSVPLDGRDADLPMTISLKGRNPEVGRAGLSLCRRMPHLVCDLFIPRLGTNHEWQAGRHTFDAAKALSVVFEHLRGVCSSANGLALCLPSYLTREQIDWLWKLASKAKLPLLGSVPAAIAQVLVAFKSTPWSGPALVVDADDHALTFSIVNVTANEDDWQPGQKPRSLSLLQTLALPLPRLGIRAWKARLIDAIADRCVRHSRWDLRDSADAEQMLFDQLDDVLEAARREQMVEVVVQSAHWCQNLILRPDEVRGFCAALLKGTADNLHQAFSVGEANGLQRILLSWSAARLPGLVDAAHEETEEEIPIIALPEDAGALGTHDLAIFFHRGEFPREHLEAIVRCPLHVPPQPKQKEKKRRRFLGL